jgi:hypothetical protein
MLKTTLAVLLFGYAVIGEFLSCPDNTGDSEENCCILRPNPGVSTIVHIPNSIKCAVVDCSWEKKACEKNVEVYSAADKTTFKCEIGDTCIGSMFVCGRGAPGSDQRDYDNDGVCILESTAGSAAKEAQFSVFGRMRGQIHSKSDVSFGTADIRCYGAGCDIECDGGTSCTDTGITGDYVCTGEGCDGFKEVGFEGLAPIIAVPDATNQECEIKPEKGLPYPIVFKNNCKKATLVCPLASICEKRKIYSAAQETEVTCGALDAEKTDGSFVSGACVETFMYFGPLHSDELPHGTDERDFDVQYGETDGLTGTRGEPIINKVTLNYKGSDAGSKNKVKATLSSLTINTEGASAFTGAQYQCGSEGGDNVPGTECKLNCQMDTQGKPSCVYCKRYMMDGASYVESLDGVGQDTCLDGNAANRLGIKQSGVNADSDYSSNTVNTNNNNIVLPVKSLYAFAIIFSVIIFGVIAGCSIFNRKDNKRASLLQYNTMELQNVQNKA